MCNLTFSVAIFDKLTCRTCFEVLTALFTLSTIGTAGSSSIISGHHFIVVHVKFWYASPFIISVIWCITPCYYVTDTTERPRTNSNRLCGSRDIYTHSIILTSSLVDFLLRDQIRAIDQKISKYLHESNIIVSYLCKPYSYR